MKKVVAAIIASAFAFGSLSTFAADSDHAPVRNVVVKHDRVKKASVKKVRYVRHHHHRQHHAHYRR
jgi:hypothetical protein